MSEDTPSAFLAHVARFSLHCYKQITSLPMSNNIHGYFYRFMQNHTKITPQ